ncbi:unnamed protein product [Caenorhabditis bovis]|uniref:NADP-dependent oxidoreductase domain-containing protein n=1 Tax=Caenorhabditis bovis TaxID=2654633 RepID=A0A8S1E7W8_9PELO|nr:unnamed protein product [Caenorhabditis bovis]
MPLVGFGTYKVTGEQVERVLDDALKVGYRLLDTAKVYNNEKEIGKAFEKLLPKHCLRREDVFITTKLHPSSENTRDSIVKMVDESLRLLRTSYVDLYLIHYPKPNDCHNDDTDNIEYRKNAYMSLEACKEAAKIRSIGVSSYEIKHLEEVKSYANCQPSVNQIEFHPHFIRTELVEYCKNANIFVQAFSSLAKWNEDLFASDAVKCLAEKYRVDPSTIVLSFATCQNIGIIPKSSHIERMKKNIKVIHLTSCDVDRFAHLNINQHYVRTTGWFVK